LYQTKGIVCPHIYRVLCCPRPQPQDAVIRWHKIYGYFYGRDEELTALFDSSIDNEPIGLEANTLGLNEMWPVGQGNHEKSFFTASLKHIVIRAGNILYLNSRAALAQSQVTTRSQVALEAFGLEQEIHLSQATQLPLLRSLVSKTDGNNESLTTINDIRVKDRWGQTRPCMTTTRQSIAKWQLSCKNDYSTWTTFKLRITPFCFRRRRWWRRVSRWQ
jgi:hypothetical protein